MTKGKYVDGFVLLVPNDKVNEYKKIARDAAKAWIKYGALEYKECMLDDDMAKFMPLTFPKMAKAKEGEVVWFSYIVYENKKQRNVTNQKVMEYMDKKYGENTPMPFDMKRMTMGGFKVEVGADKA